jgi:hypothetical protein
LRTLPGRNARIFKKPTSTPTVTPTPTNEPSFRATLEVSPTPPVDVNVEVTFFVVPKLPGAVEYRFNFGDGKTSGWITKPQTTYRYFEAKTYQAYAEIRGWEGLLAQGTKNTSLREVKVVRRPNPTPSATVPVRITPSPTASATATVPIGPPRYSPSPTATATASVPASPSPHTPSPTALPTATPSISPPLKVYLSVDKNPISVGDSVTFSIATNLPAKNKQYRYEVDFGDGSNPSVKTTNSFPHVFKAAGHYTASVKVLDGGSQVHADLAIFVDGGNPLWHWVYVLAGLAAAALYGILMLIKPTFRLHWNRDEPQMPLENVTINYELHFDSNISAGQDRLDVPGANLILAKRTQ